ncbi:MAG: cation:proton antiporter [Methanocellales archaeon]
MDSPLMLLELGIILLAAVIGYLALAKIKLPAVVGMLIFGMLVGPFVLNLVQWGETIDSFVELGAVFLMFSMGLEFNISRLRQIGIAAFFIAGAGALISFFLGFAFGLLLGWDLASAIFLGVLLVSTSSSIAVKLIQDMNLLGISGADLTLAAIVVDDLYGLIALTLAVNLSLSIKISPLGLILDLGLILLAVLAISIIGVKIFPALFSFVGRISRDGMVLLAVSLCFFISYFLALVQLAPMTGAFLAGSIIALTGFVDDIARFIRSARDIFAAVFFTAIGMLIDPRLLILGIPLALAISIIAFGGKFLGGYLSLKFYGIPKVSAFICAIMLVPRGEVSLIVARYGTLAGAQVELQSIAAMLMVFTALLTPAMIKYSIINIDKIEGYIERF